MSNESYCIQPYKLMKQSKPVFEREFLRLQYIMEAAGIL